MHMSKPIQTLLFLGAFALSFMHLKLNAEVVNKPSNSVGYEAAPGAEITETAKVPNLTVNFSLNSVADPATTQYYTQIVEEMLRNLPRKVSLSGDPASLVQTEPVYDHLKVVSYLPKADTDPNSLSEKDIRYFTVEFEVPEGLVNLTEVDDLPPGVESQSIVVHKGKYEDFVDILYNDGTRTSASTAPRREIGLEKAGINMNDIMGKKSSGLGQMVADTAKSQVAKERMKRSGPTDLMREIANFEVKKKSKRATPAKTIVKTPQAAFKLPSPTLKLKGVTITFNKGTDLGQKLMPLVKSGSESRRLQMIAFVSPTGAETMTDLANQRFLSAESELRAAGINVNDMAKSRIILMSSGADKLNVTLK